MLLGSAAWALPVQAADVEISDAQVTTQDLNALAPGGTTAEVTATGSVIVPNAGSAAVTASGQAWAITNAGTISQTATTNSASVAVLCQAGCTLVNTASGLISSAQAGANTISATTAGNFSLDNQGTINSAYVAINSTVAADVDNSGSITSTSKATVFTAGGTVNNSGSINSGDVAIDISGGLAATNSVTNSGTITQTGTGLGAVRLGSGGYAENTATGTIDFTGVISMGGIYIFGGDASTNEAVNAGTIISNGRGIRFDNGGTITNTGTITAGIHALQMAGGDATNSIVNDGTLNSTGAGGILGTGGTIENTANGIINGETSAIRMNAGDSATNLVINRGEINTADGYGIYVQQGGRVENDTGASIETSEYCIRVDGGNSTDNQIVNRGTLISTTQYGISINGGGGYIENTADGVIEAGTNGITLSGGIFADNNIVNHGYVHGINRAINLSAAATVNNFGTLLSDANSVTSSAAGTVINNSGLIRGMGGSVIFLGAGGTIVNSLGATIRTPSLGIHTDGALHFTNRGSLISDASGLAIDGDSNAGNTIINSGTIQGSIELSAFDDTVTLETGSVITESITGGLGTDTLTLDGNSVLASDVSGFEVLDIDADATGWESTGALDFTGGAASLNTGRYYLNGSMIADTLSTAAGTTLLGAGSFTGNLTNNATIAPGNSIGTLAINGNYTHAAGATYEVEVATDGTSDLIDVTGVADLQGGDVLVTPLAGSYNLMNDYTILSAAGGVNGTFDSVASINALFDVALDYDANNVYLSLDRNDATFVDIVPGQIGASFDAIPDANALKQQLMSQSNAVITQSLTDAAAAPYPSATAVLPLIQQKIGDIIGQRLSGGYMSAPQSGGSAASLASTFDAIAPAAGGGTADVISLAFDDEADANARQRLNFIGNGFAPVDGRYGGWLQGYGASGELSDAGATADWNFAGLAAGIDRMVAPDTLAGIAIGHARGRTEIDAAGADADARLWQVSLYGARQAGPWRLEGQAGYSLSQTDAERTIQFGGLPANLDADYDSHVFSARAEAGHDFVFENDRGHTATITPLAGFDYALMKQEGFTEQGAAGLRFKDDTTTSLRTALGVRASTTRKLENGGYIIPSFTARWRHELGDTSSNLSGTFAAAAPGAPYFDVQGMERARDEAEIGVGIGYAPTPGQNLYATYQTTQSASTSEHGIILGINVKW